MFLIFGLSLGFFVYRESQQKPIISTTLSARSQEYIKGQKAVSNDTFQNADFTGPSGPDTRNQRIGKDGCYSFVMPYRVSTTRNDPDANGNTCFARYSFDVPKGAITVYKSQQNATSWDDIGGVKFRRDHKDEYTEEQKTFNGTTYLIFRLKGDLYESNVFYFTPDYTFTFNLLTKTNKDLDADLYSMLESLEIE